MTLKIIVTLLISIQSVTWAKSKCSLSKDLVTEIQSYKTDVEAIIENVVNGPLSGEVWNLLLDFIDKFGNRVTGSKTLENAIDYMVDASEEFKLDNVHTEPVTVPGWFRGNESATMLKPRWKKLEILGLGGSVGTDPEGITAEAIVVENYKELFYRSSQARGKIVVFAPKWEGYGTTRVYRTRSASIAARLGAVATLIRSITPYSLYTPHTGQMDYVKSIKKIPAACITVEDAELLLRMDRKGKKIVINLKMEAKRLKSVKTRNTIADLTGSSIPKQYVAVTAHLDSWDIGEGVVDDGAGAFVAWYTPILLKKIGLIPRRTVRTILWTGEEQGLYGALAYKRDHSESDVVMILETDEGTFTPTGLSVKGSLDSVCIFKEILQLLDPLNVNRMNVTKSVGSDISVWADSGIPQAHLTADGGKYFRYHHSNADDMTAVDPNELDKCVAVLAAVSYVVADLSVRMPRGPRMTPSLLTNAP